MSGIFNLETEVRVLACPACGITMNTAQQRCPSCNGAIGHDEAERAANAMAFLNQACSEANYIGGLLGTLFGLIGAGVLAVAKLHISFLVISAIGLTGIAASFYCPSVLAALGMPIVIALAIHWWVRYAAIQTTDPDFPRSKRTVLFSAAIAILFDLAMAALTFKLHQL